MFEEKVASVKANALIFGIFDFASPERRISVYSPPLECAIIPEQSY